MMRGLSVVLFSTSILAVYAVAYAGEPAPTPSTLNAPEVLKYPASDATANNGDVADGQSIVDSSTELKEPSSLSPSETWQKVLMLINESGGYIWKDKVETAFGVSLSEKTGRPSIDHYVNYRLDSKRTWPFSINLSEYTSEYKSAISSGTDGAHSSWYFGWIPASVGESAKGDCVTAGTVRSDLIKNGWIAPAFWGTSERPPAFTLPASCSQPGAPACSVPSTPPEGIAFFRKTPGNGLPVIEVISGQKKTSGEASACVNSISVDARP